MRSQDEIVARFTATRSNDVLGWKAEVLLTVMDQDHAASLMPADKWGDLDWPPLPDDVEDALRDDAVGYLKFAFGKASDHRGISTARSIVKMGEYLWLLKLETVGFDAAPYTMYGAPKLVVAAGLLQVPVPVDDDVFMAMAMGNACRPDCTSCNMDDPVLA